MLKTTNLSKIFLVLVFLSSLLIISPVSALSLKDSFSDTSNFHGFATKSGYTDATKTPEYYIGLLLTGFFSILGVIAVALIIYSGFVWMTARGNQSKVDKAKETITEVLIGLIFIIGGYALTTFILKIFA